MKLPEPGSQHHATPAEADRYRPRIIIWQMPAGEPGALTLNESLLVIDSIARLAKPIIVFTGDNTACRPDLHEIIAYATTLGIKSIIEITPAGVTPDVVERFREFGPRIFRIIIDGCVIEDMETRYRQTPGMEMLEKAVVLLRSSGFEIHFSLTITKPDSRALAFNLDYAFRRSANGLYCHLCIPRLVRAKGSGTSEPEIDTFISEISELKPALPGEMYFSPQCIRFGAFHSEEIGNGEPEPSNGGHKWTQWCVAGKSFAFISGTGDVRPCSACPRLCGNLRSQQYDFPAIWNGSPVFRMLREHRWSCAETRRQFNQKKSS
jgi:AdoMet-dependent heme synthase